MSPDVADGPEMVVLDALDGNLLAMRSRFARGEEGALHEHEDALYFDTPIPTLPYDGVLRFRVATDAERRIDAIFDHYRRRDVPFFWLVHPTARPSDLSERLRARGLEEAEVVPGMAMGLSELEEPGAPPSGIAIHEAATSNTETVLEMVAWRWDVPNEVAPRPEARGSGLARMLTLHALHAARDAGHTLGVLHSAPLAVGLYETLGFRAIAPFSVFAAPRTLHL